MVGELVITGIDRLVGTQILGRRIAALKVMERYGPSSKCYSFTIHGSTEFKPGQHVRDWDSEFSVVLTKFPKNGAYELFCMGWHGITCVLLHRSEIENKDVFISYFEDTLYKLKKYSEDEKAGRASF
jgi:hypothetical protein